MIAHHAETGNAPSLVALADQLLGFVRHAADQQRPAHEVERAIWDRVLQLGREAFALFLRLHGTGAVGPRVPLPDGSTADRLPTTHARGYRSVFGDFTLARTCYGTRDGQRIAFVPLDNRLQLPESNPSYLLQEWDAALGCESAFARVAATVRDLLGVEQPVDSLERNHRRMAEAVESFRDARPVPDPVEVLDILHVTPRLWQAAHLFCREGTPAATAFVRERVERILDGGVKGVVAGLRRLGTLRGLSGSRKKTLGTICGYLWGTRVGCVTMSTCGPAIRSPAV